MKISRYFDSAILKPNMTEDEVKQAIKDCIACDSYTVCAVSYTHLAEFPL